MFKNIKRFVFVFVFLGIAISSTLPASVDMDKWGNTIFDAFQKLVSKELLSFGKSDRAATTKDELLERSKALKESLGGFAEVVKLSKDKVSTDKAEKHQGKIAELTDKKVEIDVATNISAPVPAPVPVISAPAAVPAASAAPALLAVAPVVPAPVPVPEVNAAPAQLPVVPAAPVMPIFPPVSTPIVAPAPVVPASLPVVPASLPVVPALPVVLPAPVV